MKKIKNMISNLLRFRNTIRAFLVAVVLAFLLVFMFVVNVKQVQKINDMTRVDEPYRVVLVVNKPSKSVKREMAIEKTAEIIVRDGKNVNPATAKKYAKWIYAAGEKHKVNPVLILSVMSVESNFNAKAQSPTGPIGLLQVAYTHHKEKTTRAGLYDPKNNIDVGTQILAEYKGANDARTLNRYYGGGSAAVSSAYARKVILHKHKYEKEISRAVYVNTI